MDMPDFIPASSFSGGRSGYVFKKDTFGLGYYRDMHQQCQTNNKAESFSTALHQQTMSLQGQPSALAGSRGARRSGGNRRKFGKKRCGNTPEPQASASMRFMIKGSSSSAPQMSSSSSHFAPKIKHRQRSSNQRSRSRLGTAGKGLLQQRQKPPCPPTSRLTSSRETSWSRRSAVKQQRQNGSFNRHGSFGREKSYSKAKPPPRPSASVTSFVLGGNPIGYGNTKTRSAPKGCRSSVCGKFWIDKDGAWIPR